MTGVSPDRAHPGLHSKPLEAAIGRVPAPFCLAAAVINEFVETTQTTNNNNF